MLLLKFILAFCSLSYELILAQGLSAFLDNTVLRYSTTIGLYMFTMGLGSFASTRMDGRRPALMLWQVEILLTLVGGVSLISLFVLSGFSAPRLLIMTGAYAWVALIGFLTGLELPLMLRMSAPGSVAGEGNPSRGKMIGVDYAGAFVATIVFVFYFYPWAGLVRSAMAVVLLNACAAVFIAWRWRADIQNFKDEILASSVLLAGGALALLFSSGPLGAQLMTLYLKGH